MADSIPPSLSLILGIEIMVEGTAAGMAIGAGGAGGSSGASIGGGESGGGGESEKSRSNVVGVGFGCTGACEDVEDAFEWADEKFEAA